MEMKAIAGYEGMYSVAEDGQIWSHHSNRFLKPKKHPSGYRTVNLSKDGVAHTYYIHRLVAEAFIPNPDNLPQINHKDEDKTNNAVSNLEWMSAIDNNNYGTRNERIAKKVRCVETGEEFNSCSAAARAVNHTTASLSNALKKGHRCANYHWEYVKEEVAC